jgi:NAD(P)H-dependent glutamate synthase small subunit
MANPTGFRTESREEAPKRPVAERVKDHREVEERLPLEKLEKQASRCMDCGIPFCHMYGCPLGNLIPDFNDLVYRKQWRKALELLHARNPFPEITGRICPALCEAACTLSVGHEPVTIRQIEMEIVERGWENGWIAPQPAAHRSGKRVAVIGSGPAGLAAAQWLARRGHRVVVFEKAEKPGGILRYGIPDFKLEKRFLDRRLEQLQAEGVVFETGVEAGADISARYLRKSFDAILLAAGARIPRDLNVPGRELDGMYQALDFLTQQNRINMGEEVAGERISAEGKDVVVIGGGDTGADCIGTCRRQGAREITQIELLPEPPADRPADNPWPTWPRILRESSSHKEGCERLWSIGTKEFLGKKGKVEKLHCVKLDWSKGPNGNWTFREIEGTDFEISAQLVLLAMGFVHVEHGPLVKDLGLQTDARGNIVSDEEGKTAVSGVFVAGDAASGASLVVRAMDSGIKAARALDASLAHAEN